MLSHGRESSEPYAFLVCAAAGSLWLGKRLFCIYVVYIGLMTFGSELRSY